MIYYYAYTGHKIGLERAKRGVAVIKALANSGAEAQLLVNDFRAGAAMEAYGIESYVTIETVRDIDAVASRGDVVIIDSPEDHSGRLERYCSEYQVVFRFAQKAQERVCYDEVIIKPACEEEGCIDAVIVDDTYFEPVKKSERLLFFLGDADHEKILLKHQEFFQAFEMELLLGNYFFVSYERVLAPLFSVLHEPETYISLMKSSSVVVTASGQAAMEAKATGAKVVYLDLGSPSLYTPALLETYGIAVVQGFDSAAVKEAIIAETGPSLRKVIPFDISTIESHYQ